MEKRGKVALYEECEIVSVYDSGAADHSTYIVAPRASVSDRIWKGVLQGCLLKSAAKSTYLYSITVASK